MPLQPDTTHAVSEMNTKPPNAKYIYSDEDGVFANDDDGLAVDTG